MAKSYLDVQQEFEAFKRRNPDDPSTLESYAKGMDELTGAAERQAAYEKPGFFTKVNAGIDTALEKTGIPAIGEFAGGVVGTGLDELLGTHVTSTLADVGKSVPRMVGEGALTVMQPEAGGPMLLSRLAMLGKVLGYGSAFTRGTAETGSPVGGVISAGSLGLANKIIPAAGTAAERALTRLLERGTADVTPEAVELAKVMGPSALEAAPDAVRRGLPQVANVAAGAASMIPLNEATRQAEMSVGPNAVAWNDPSRNPLTQENVAGNVAGTAFFLPQLLHSLKAGGPRVSPKQVEQFGRQVQTEVPLTTEGATEVAPEVPKSPLDELVAQTVTPTTEAMPTVPDRQTALMNILERSIENRREYAKDGRTDEVARLDQTIEDSYNELVSGKYNAVTDENKARLQAAVNDTIKFQPPDTPEKFRDLATLIKSNLDFLNEGRVNYEQELAAREAALNVNDRKAVAEFRAWKAEQERRASPKTLGEGERQTWHPQARASQVIERLWKSGDLPPLTEDWMKSEWNATFDESGNPQFSNQVLAQKMANYYADRLDAAVAQEKATRKVDVPEYTGTKVDAQEKQFIESLQTLPKEVLRDVLNRTVEIRNSERIDQRTGQPVTPMKEWQRAVIRAGQSYDPASGTILLSHRGKPGEGPQFKRVPITRLVEKSGQGYAWTPSERRVSVSEGGKPAVTNAEGQQVAEGNLEALKRPSGEQIDIGDEEAFKRALAEQSDLPFGERTDLALDPTNKLEEPVVDVMDEAGLTRESNVSEKLSEKLSTLKTNLAKLSDDELWRLAEPVLTPRNSVEVAKKKPQLRNAIIAALENLKAGKGNLSEAGKKFLAEQRAAGSTYTLKQGDTKDAQDMLRTFFKVRAPVEGSTSKLAPHQERLAMLVAKLTDEGTMKRVKSGGPGVKFQDSTADRAEYDRIQGELSKLGHDKIGTPEYQKLWQQSEDLKNKYEGMVPPQQERPMQFVSDEQPMGVYRTTLTREPGSDSQWRLSYFTRDNEPLGHKTYDSWTEPHREMTDQKYRDQEDLIGTWKEVPVTRMAREQVSVDEGSPGTLTNPPAAGQFTHDVYRTLRTRIDQLLGRAGYSGTTKEFYTELAVALAQQGHLPNLDFYRIGGDQYGLASQEYKGRANLGLNVDRTVRAGDEAKATLQLLQTLGHEIGHLDGYIRDGLITKPDAYSEERSRILKNFDEFGKSLTEDERQGMLEIVKEYIPENLRSNIRQSDGRPYGTSNPDEFAQEMRGYAMSILAHETPAGRAAAKEMLDYAPTEVRELFRDTFRTVADIMQVMRDAVEKPDERANAGLKQVLTANTDPFIMSRGFETMLDTARNMSTLRYADKAMADARGWMAQLQGPPDLTQTQSVWYTKSSMPAAVKSQASFPDRPSDTSIEAVRDADAFLKGPRAQDRAAKPNLLERFIMPFRNEMWALERNGNKMARPIADTIFQLEGGSHRLLSSMLTDFMKRGTDGSVKFDAENPLIQRIATERTGRWRDAINQISKWQQEVHEMEGGVKKDAQSLFVQNEKGELVPNSQVKGAQAFWDKMRTQFSKEDQQFIASQSFVLDKVGQRARDTLLLSVQESNINRVTSLLMSMNKKMDFDTANRLGAQTYDAFLRGNVASLQGTLPPQQVETLARLLQGPDGKSGLLKNFTDVSEHFNDRPGYRSEALPHDWIVRYRKPDGKVMFDSRPQESQALALARRLQSQGYIIDGEIVNKKDMAKFSPADDPDGILTKVTERENFVWNKFVDEMTQKHGAQFGADLQAGYTPMESTMRDVSTQGVQKFLKERKNFVDRDSFDYIDSTLAYTERLAYAAAVRSMKQRVELLLNDPSVRLQTTFQNLVRGHVQEMLRPQNETMKQMKGIVTGMMIGGNLGSVAANAMQSLSTLVPVLDLMNGKGNFVKPWMQLARGIADATDFTLRGDWKDLAAQTRGRDPKTWTADQTVAELWRRQVEAGGFTHTVVDDLIYGQDQKLLTNAKFGRGDYGPVTKASMLRSGAYLANQFAMKPFRWVEHGNAKVAFLAGARQAYEQGLRGDAAYAKAAQLQGLATFGGGRANSSGLQTALSKGFTPGGAGLALALQQYGFGIVAMHGQFVKDALGRSKGLSASEVWHARRAYGTYLMTQTALAGALGFPLVGATLTALEQVFGIPANQAVRQGLANLGSDDESGATIAEVGLNGIADYLTGLDVSSRLGTSSLLGTSSYRGFNFSDLAGPVGSILENGVKSLNYFAQNEPMKAASSLAPIALKRAIDLTDSQNKYGDNGIRDAAGNLLYTPTATQAGAYAFGFRPRELSRKRQLQQALQTADTLTNQSRDHELDTAAQDLLRGDPSSAQRLGMDAMSADPVNGMQTMLRGVMDRAVAAQTPKDPLATGSKWNEEERSQIYRTFGSDVAPRRSEVDMQNLRLQMAQLLGDPRVAPTSESYTQAAIVDSLVKGGSMPRSQAVRLVQFLGF